MQAASTIMQRPHFDDFANVKSVREITEAERYTEEVNRRVAIYTAPGQDYYPFDFTNIRIAVRDTDAAEIEKLGALLEMSPTRAHFAGSFLHLIATRYWTAKARQQAELDIEMGVAA